MPVRGVSCDPKWTNENIYEMNICSSAPPGWNKPHWLSHTQCNICLISQDTTVSSSLNKLQQLSQLHWSLNSHMNWSKNRAGLRTLKGFPPSFPNSNTYVLIWTLQDWLLPRSTQHSQLLLLFLFLCSKHKASGDTSVTNNEPNYLPNYWSTMHAQSTNKFSS